MKNFNELPTEIKEKVKNTLKAYDECNVIFEYGKYNVSCGISIKAQYATDHDFIGTYKATDIYTNDERIINYINTFHEYPIQYKGLRNYPMLKELSKLRQQGVNAKIELINGNATMLMTDKELELMYYEKEVRDIKEYNK